MWNQDRKSNGSHRLCGAKMGNPVEVVNIVVQDTESDENCKLSREPKHKAQLKSYAQSSKNRILKKFEAVLNQNTKSNYLAYWSPDINSSVK